MGWTRIQGEKRVAMELRRAHCDSVGEISISIFTAPINPPPTHIQLLLFSQIGWQIIKEIRDGDNKEIRKMKGLLHRQERDEA